MVLGGGIQRFRARFKIAAAQITIPAHGVNMDTLDGGRGHDAGSCALSAMGAKRRVKLPYHLPGFKRMGNNALVSFPAMGTIEAEATFSGFAFS